MISNNYSNIVQFLDEIEGGCFKPYYTYGWKTNDGIVQAVTSYTNSTDNFDKESFECYPHIYQEYIRKKFEYRLTIFGNFSASVRIDTQKLGGDAGVDWRSTPEYLSNLAPVSPPDYIVTAARGVLFALGLRFGTFDIAETVDGEYVFFEVNEAGQWLWKELRCPECRILHPFCEYLLSANDSFTWDSRDLSPSYEATAVVELLTKNPRFSTDAEFVSPDEEEHFADER